MTNDFRPSRWVQTIGNSDVLPRPPAGELVCGRGIGGDEALGGLEGDTPRVSESTLSFSSSPRSS